MTYAFTPISEQRLIGVHPTLVKIVRRAQTILEAGHGPEIQVIEGVRSDEQCFINFGKGRTAQQCLAGGCPSKYSQPHLNKVTWLNHALSCNHRKKADGFGHAVDLFPGTWTVQPGGAYDQEKAAMFQAAKELGAHIRWGADWNQNGKCHEHGETDNPHFELL